MSRRVLDLFCGAGGWSEGAVRAGLDPIGLDTDADACRSSRAAGHRVVRCDVSRYPPEAFAPARGIIASPPCTAFSMAGRGKGRDEADRLHAAVEACREGYVAPEGPWEDDTAPLVLEVLRWTDSLEPTWLACEQVPPVLGLWEHMADVLRDWGYSAGARKLCAADWGVPQTRRRAFLLAHREGVTWPEPTHAEHPEPGLFRTRERWVTMAEALGWTPGAREYTARYGGWGGHQHIPDSEPAPTVAPSHGRDIWTVLDGRGDSIGEYERSPKFGVDRPSRVLTEKARSWTLQGNNSVNGEGRAERDDDEPAMTVGGRADLWRILNPGRTDAQPNRRLYRPLEPAPTVSFGHDANNWRWELRRPATTVQATGRVGRPGHKDWGSGESQFEEGARRITIEEAAVLQGFPSDYPFRGSRTSRFRQIGRAVPPTWAEPILGALL